MDWQVTKTQNLCPSHAEQIRQLHGLLMSHLAPLTVLLYAAQIHFFKRRAAI